MSLTAIPTLDCSDTLVGPTLTLRPIQENDFEALYLAAADPLIWEQHPDPLRYQKPIFEAHVFKPALACAMAYVAVDNHSKQLIGSSRFYDYEPDKQEIAVGYTFLSRTHWGGASNREMKKLMLDHAFAAGVRRVWFHVGTNNMRSRKALEKIGASFSHEGVKVMLGATHNYVFYTLDHPHTDYAI